MEFEMKKEKTFLFEQAITSRDIQREPSVNLEDFSAVSERGVATGFSTFSDRYAITYENYPYLFKRGTLSVDTSAKDEKIGLCTIAPDTSLIGEQFEKTEKAELMKKMSFTIERLIHKDEGFKIIRRQKLLDKMSGIADALTLEQIKDLENEINQRMEEIMAIEAMGERLRR
jgi:hypothetical protein